MRRGQTWDKTQGLSPLLQNPQEELVTQILSCAKLEEGKIIQSEKFVLS